MLIIPPSKNPKKNKNPKKSKNKSKNPKKSKNSKKKKKKISSDFFFSAPRHLPEQLQGPLLRQGVAGHQRVDRDGVGPQAPRRQRGEELQGERPVEAQGGEDGVVDDEIPGIWGFLMVIFMVIFRVILGGCHGDFMVD